MNSGKVLLGLLAGIAAGATLGILFSPEKGSVTRKKISKIGDEYVAGLGSKFDDLIENVTGKFESLITETTQMAKNTKAKAEDKMDELMSSGNMRHNKES
jgi:gas vesicle protein